MLKYEESDFKDPFVEVSEFKVVFPSYREGYIKKNMSRIEEVLGSKKLSLYTDLATRTLCVRTNVHTRDPYIIIKGEQFLRLISRGVPLDESSRVLEDGVFCDIIKVDGLVRRKEVFEKRRERLIGKNEAVIRALKLLTKCYIHVQRSTVSCIGPYRGVNEVKDVVLKTMKNIHPVFLVKQLIVKRKLEKDEKMKNESWERYIPPIHKKHRRARKGPQEKTKRKEQPASQENTAAK